MLYDIELVDFDGKAVRFKSDPSQPDCRGRVHLRVARPFARDLGGLGDVQERLIERLGDQFGRDVKLITLTVDPATDTPKRLKDYATNFGSPAGWIWLTGDKPKVNRVLAGMGAYAADFTRHSGAVLVGDARTGDWTRFYGIPNAPDIVDRVEQLLAARKPADLTERK